MGYKFNPFTGKLDRVEGGTVAPNIETLTGDSGGAIGPDAAFNINLLGNASQGTETAGAGNTITFTNLDATTSQKGVQELATDAESIAGSDTVRSIVPSALEAKLGVLTSNSVPFGQGTGSAIGWTAALTDGQLVIGSTAGSPGAANLTAGTGIAVTNAANSITLGLNADTQVTAIHFGNGAILETAAVTVTSDGATITCSVQQNGGGDLTVVFSDGFDAWDTTPADTVTLTAGTDTAPTQNFVYYLQSNKTLTASTVGWPTTEHAPIATVICESAATVQTNGAYKVHAWTDHQVAPNEQGHLSDLNFWIRHQNATWDSGVNQTFTITPNGGAADNVLITTIAGVVLQLHTHVFPAFSGTPDYYVVNDSVTPFTIVTDLNALLTDSSGVSMSGKYFSLVLWGVVSEDTGDCKLFINLPSGSYNNQASVEADAQGFATFDIPSDFKGTGFLIAEWKLRHQAAASGTWTSIDEIDLRGLIPSITPTGSTATPTTFADNAFRIFDDADNTKLIAFEASNITTATTRTITMVDADLDLATVSNSFPTDSGTAAPTANVLTIAGGTNINTSGATTVVTVNLDTNISVGTIDSTEVTIDPGASGDSFVQFDINTTGEFRIGVDDTDDSFRISQGSALGTNDTQVITAAGEITFPLTPAFYAQHNVAQANVTGAGTQVTVVFGTEVFDQNNDFDGTSTFTAPITGRYRFTCQIFFTDLGAANTTGDIQFTTSNRNYTYRQNVGAMRSAANSLSTSFSVFVDMDAADTCIVQAQVSGGAGDTVDIPGSATTCYFMGQLEC